MKVLAHERLGELLNVLKTVVGKYDEINSTEILNMARELIKYVKGKFIVSIVYILICADCHAESMNCFYFLSLSDSFFLSQ